MAFLLVNSGKAQKISLHGKLGEADFVLVEQTIAEIFSRTQLIGLTVLYEKSELVKVDRNIGIDATTLKSYYHSVEAFAEVIDCSVAQKIISSNQHASIYRNYVGLIAYSCSEENNTSYPIFINSVVTAINNRIRPEIGMFFNKTKPEILVKENLSSNSTLSSTKISGTCESLVNGKIYVVEDGSITTQIPLTQDWETNLRSVSSIKNLEIFAVNEKGDTSNVIALNNVSVRKYDINSLKMYHPGGMQKNGTTSDVVLKCNTLNMNGLYNFQFLIDRNVSMKDVVLSFENVNGNMPITKLYLDSLDESLIGVSSIDKDYNKVCVYLVYSRFGFVNPCSIDDSFVYSISCLLPNGLRIETPKKRIYFESFRENYDETPCICN